MATTTGVFKRTSAVGVREDLENSIYRIEQEETPIVTLADKISVKNTYHEWQVDSLVPANRNNARVEGADAAESVETITTRVGNRTQIFGKEVKVSNTLEAVDKAGRDSEYGRQKANALAELKRDLEAAIGSNEAPVIDDGSSTAGRLGGLEAYIKTNVDATGAQGVYTSGVPAAATDGAKRDFKESQLKAVLKKLFNVGAKPDTIIANGTNIDIFTTFTGRGDPVSQASDGTIFNFVDLYRGPYGGKLKIVPSAFVAQRGTSPSFTDTGRSILILDTGKYAIGTLRDTKEIELGAKGDYKSTQIVTEKTLVVRNELAHGKIADLNP